MYLTCTESTDSEEIVIYDRKFLAVGIICFVVEESAKTMCDFEYYKKYMHVEFRQRGRGTFQDIISQSAPSQFCGTPSDIDRYVPKSLYTGFGAFIHPVTISTKIAVNGLHYYEKDLEKKLTAEYAYI